MDNFWEAIEEIWDDTQGDPSVCVAVLDGPVDLSHRSLHRSALTPVNSPLSTNPTDGFASRHGTLITSIIFGQPDGMVRGIAPNCRGLLIPIFKDNGGPDLPSCTQADLARAIDHAANAGAHIINISAGEFPRQSDTDPLLEEAVRNCAKSKVLVIAASGERGCACPQIPSALPGVLAIGTMDVKTNLLACDNWSKDDEPHCLLAPGKNIIGAYPGNRIGQESGSSCATAIVSGVAALLLSLQLKYHHDLDVKLVRDVLLGSAHEEKSGSVRMRGRFLNVRGAAFLLKKNLGILAIEAPRMVGARTPHFHRQGKYILEESSNHPVYTVSQQALMDKYGNVLPEKFGTVDIAIPAGNSYNITDLHYYIAPGRKGMRLVPVSDEKPVILPDGRSGPGYEAVDNLLRQEMHLKPEDPIFALLGYIRPEEHSVDLPRLPYTEKMQLGFRHLAVYVGGGRTTHASPRKTEWKGEGPLNMKWNVDLYPATVYILSLHGVPQSTLNRNAHIVDTLLAPVAREPEDPRSLKCRTFEINTTLQYYRDSIRQAEYLEDRAWFTNCAVHKTIVINVLLNLPHNAQSFYEIFGYDGIQLWEDFKRRYEEILGEPFSPAKETFFTPLWKLAGLPAEGIRPLTFAEYSSFHAANEEGWLEEYEGRRPLEPSKGLAWPLETVVDLVSNFMRMYVSFQNVGGIIAAGELLLLRHLAKVKLGMTEEDYLALVCPTITKLIIADGLAEGKRDPLWPQNVALELFNWVKQAETWIPSNKEASLKPVIDECVESTKSELTNLTLNGRDEQIDAAVWLRRVLAPELDRLRAMVIARNINAAFFSTPSILHQITLGLHPKSPFVRISSICTVMEQEELTLEPLSAAVGIGNPAASIRSALLPSHIDHQIQIYNEELTMKNMDMSLRQEDKKMENSLTSHVDLPHVTPSADDKECETCGNNQSVTPGQLVYALGQIGYDVVSQSRRDSIKQKMAESGHPEQPMDLLAYLDEHPYEAPAIQWILKLEGTPIYLIEPRGAFARDAYELLRQFLREQVQEGVERVSIPGLILGTTRLRSGMTVPALAPEIRGMYSWTTEALVNAVVGPEQEEEDKKKDHAAKRQGISNFLQRVYYEIRNLGIEPQDRALNFAATNAFELERVFEQVIREGMELDTIEVERSPVCPLGADCWDVKLVFFFPLSPVQTTRRVYRFTVDVADIVPATVGQMRSWSIR